MKKLRLSKEHKLVAGVLGGFGEYFAIDPVAVRLLFVLLLLLTGIFPGLLLYSISWILIPEGTAIAPSKPVTETPTVSDIPVKDTVAHEVPVADAPTKDVHSDDPTRI